MRCGHATGTPTGLRLRAKPTRVFVEWCWNARSQRKRRDMEGAIMATTALTAQDFEQTLTSNELVLVDFWATWCGPCKAFGPVYEKASEANPDIVFAKVDIDQNQELASAADIKAVPTLMIAKKGQIIFKQAGALRGSDLDDLIAQAKSLDLDAAKAQSEDAVKA
ncbi:thioredoxin [Bifidobacterium tibiigranuli]|uniref:thioredoxin n=1 Tax=Bifidobacterium tibiigranuli TaxID=2172043 RepID=UPI003DAA3045